MTIKRAIQAFITSEKVKLDKIGSEVRVTAVITQRNRRPGSRLGTCERKGYNTRFEVLDRNGGSVCIVSAEELSALSPETPFDFYEALGISSDINIHKAFALSENKEVQDGI